MIGRKSKIAVAPGTELDYDNPDHRRHIEDEAYSEPPHPRPTMATPERSRFWWFWRAFGYLFFVPVRRVWAYYSFAYYPRLPDDSLGPWTHRFPSSEAAEKWLRGIPGTPRWLWKVRGFLYWLLERNWSFDCPHCGFDDYGEDYTIYAESDDEEDRTIELFNFLEGGGTDYFGEANDCHGWQWCFRCGNREWETH